MEERSHTISYLLLFLSLHNDIVITSPKFLSTIAGLFHLCMSTVAEIVLIDFRRGTTQDREIPCIMST